MSRPPLARKALALIAAYAIALHALFMAATPFMPAGAGPFAMAICAPSGHISQDPGLQFPDQAPRPDHFGCALCPLAHCAPLVLSGATIVLFQPASMRLALPLQPAPHPIAKHRLPVARGPPRIA